MTEDEISDMERPHSSSNVVIFYDIREKMLKNIFWEEICKYLYISEQEMFLTYE